MGQRQLHLPAKVEFTTEAELKSVGTPVTSIASTRMAEAHCVRTHRRADFEIHLLNQRFERGRITSDYQDCMGSMVLRRGVASRQVMVKMRKSTTRVFCFLECDQFPPPGPHVFRFKCTDGMLGLILT